MNELQKALQGTSPMLIADEEGWNLCKENNQGPYGGRVVRYAEEWARLMQARMEQGETVASCADELSHLADDDGITGFMYGAAVSILAKAWKHGEELRTWHNAKYGAPDAKGTVNPAIVTIQAKD